MRAKVGSFIPVVLLLPTILVFSVLWKKKRMRRLKRKRRKMRQRSK